MSIKFPSVACMYFILQVTKNTRKKCTRKKTTRTKDTMKNKWMIE